MEIDLYQEVYSLLKQIPKGKVTTYGVIAEALGDKIAARGVGRILKRNPHPKSVPCYKVVRANGKIGGYKLGKERKKHLLESDGIKVQNDRIVNFKEHLFKNFETSQPLQRLKEEQKKLAEQVVLEDHFKKTERIGGIDVSYQKRDGYGACVVLNRESKLLETNIVRKKVNFPYIPTYLSYRELPVAKAALEGLKEKCDVVFVDGNGLIHPRLGFASHLGVIEDLPTIGVAKNLLCGEVEKEPKHVGEREPVILNGQIIGFAVKTFERANPIYVSPGHLVSLDSAVRLTLDFCKYKLPEPVRKAHKASTRQS